jgi:enoyl-CoA hydratase/carnithine racemase
LLLLYPCDTGVFEMILFRAGFHPNLSNALSKTKVTSLRKRLFNINKVRPFSAADLKNIAFPQDEGSVRKLSLQTLKVDFSETGVLTLKLNRPDRGNAFNIQMWQEFRRAFEAIDGDKQVRVAVLCGSSTTFSTGMDLMVFNDIQREISAEKCQGRAAEALGRVIQFLQDSVSAPEQCKVPVIAAVSGHCIGGAIDVITACDIRYCTDDATFSIKETDLAIVADIGTLQRLPKLIGDQTCRELAYTGRLFNGKEAERLGLVLRSFPTEQEMQEHVKLTAELIAEKSPLTIR